MIIPVRIAEWDLKLAASIATERTANGRARHLDQYGCETNGGQSEFIGVLGEMLTAKWLNLYWGDHLVINGIDVGELVEVRASNFRPTHGLPIHPKDKEIPFVLVDASERAAMILKLIGWYYGSEAKTPERWADPVGKGRPAFWVPPDELLPCEQLRKFCHEIAWEGPP